MGINNVTKTENGLVVLLPLFSFLADSGAKRKVKTFKALLTTKLNIIILVLLRGFWWFFCVIVWGIFFTFQYFSRSQFIRVSFIVIFLKKIKANSKFFQLLTSSYCFVLTAFVRLNINPSVILF